MSRRILTLASLLCLAALTSCKGGGTTSIKTLLDDPAAHDKKTVRIAGDVTRSIGLLGYGAYEISDGTGTLPVVSQENGAPREGAKVGVEGEFRAAFTLGTRTAAVVIEKRRLTE